MSAELGLAGCSKVPDFALQRVFHACPTLERLDLSFCGAVSDPLLLSLGQHCRRLQQLKLHGCRQVSDAGVVGLANSGGGELVSLDLARFDLQYKLNDISLLSLAEKCRALESLVLAGCEMLTDVGLSWLCSGCAALTRLDLSGCAKLTDLAMHSIGESLIQLRHLGVSHCVRVSDLGIRHLAMGCPELTHLDAVGLALLADPRPSDVDSAGERRHQGIAALALRCTKLRHLNISRCTSIGDGSLHFLAMNSRALAELNVSGCVRVTAAGVHQLLAALASTLTSLNVSECEKVGDRTFGGIPVAAAEFQQHFAQDSSRPQTTALASLAPLRQLKSLRLRNCLLVTDATLKSLGGLGLSLRELDLSGCSRVSDMGVLALVDSPPIAEALRHLWLRALVEVTETGLSWIAEKCRKLLLLDLTGCSRIKSFSIKALADCWKFAAYSKSEHFTGMAPKHRAEDWLVIEQYGDCWRAATRIQSLYRARVARRVAAQKREEKLILWVATRLQSVYRGRQARKLAILKRMQLNKEIEAAKCIQAKFRQRKAVERVALMRETHRQQRLQDAARFIQMAWRRKCVRDKLAVRTLLRRAHEEQLQRAATKLQRVWRGKQARTQTSLLRVARAAKDHEEHDAANKMQSLFRARAARREVARRRQELRDEDIRRERAAVRVQAHVRRRRAQKVLSARLMHAKQVNDAATRIQRRWRAKKRWFASQLVVFARRRKEEYDAAVTLQAAWKRRQGRAEARLLRLIRGRAQQQVEQAALKVQTHWRAKRARVQVAGAKQLAVEKVLLEAKMQHRAAALVQAHFRGRRGRERYREMVLLKKKRWKEVVQPENGQKFYYVRAAVWCRWCRWCGSADRACVTTPPPEQRDRRSSLPPPAGHAGPAAEAAVRQLRYALSVSRELTRAPSCTALTLMFGGLCSESCDAHRASGVQGLRRDVLQHGACAGSQAGRTPPPVFSNMPGLPSRQCWSSVHAGGKRRRHDFRCLYDFYEKRVDYGDGEFPSKWPTEIEQDEKDGWGLRMYPRRQPAEVRESWERYVDADTGREWFYNKDTEASSYSPPSAFQPVMASDGSESALSEQQLASGEWSKHYDDAQSAAYYYNSRTLESTFARPADFVTARQAPSAREGGAGWEKYVDPASGYPYYYNSQTAESTFARPSGFQTARRGAVAIEVGGSDWAKYYDLTQGLYYYYNARTLESSFARPTEFATPRVAPADAVTLGMTEFYDAATAKAYFFNTQTAECQAAVAASSAWASQMRGYR